MCCLRPLAADEESVFSQDGPWWAGNLRVRTLVPFREAGVDRALNMPPAGKRRPIAGQIHMAVPYGASQPHAGSGTGKDEKEERVKPSPS